MSTAVHHDIERRIFVADVEGEEAVIEYGRPDEKTIDLFRTYVPDAGRGQGIAGLLMKAAIAYAEAEGLRVVPTCS